MKAKAKLILELFLTFFKIGLFTFGGGYAMISIIQDEAINKKKWIDDKELMNIISIAESTPGPVSVNSSTFIGCKMAGFVGSVAATLGLVLPSFIIIYIISLFFDEFMKFGIVQDAFAGIQVAVGFLIITAGVRLFKKLRKDVYSMVAISITTVLMLVLEFVENDFSPIYLILLGMLCGFTLSLIAYIREKKKTALSSASAGTDHGASAGEDKDAGTEEVKERVLKEPVSGEERKSTTDAGAAEEKKDQEPGEEGREEDRK